MCLISETRPRDGTFPYKILHKVPQPHIFARFLASAKSSSSAHEPAALQHSTHTQPVFPGRLSACVPAVLSCVSTYLRIRAESVDGVLAASVTGPAAAPVEVHLHGCEEPRQPLQSHPVRQLDHRWRRNERARVLISHTHTHIAFVHME